MPWYFPWSDSIKKRAVRYLLQHYMGHLLKEKLSLQQLTVDLYNGKGMAKDILLDVAVSIHYLDHYLDIILIIIWSLNYLSPIYLKFGPSQIGLPLKMHED